MNRLRPTAARAPRDPSPEPENPRNTGALAIADRVLSRIPSQYKQRGFSNLSEVVKILQAPDKSIPCGDLRSNCDAIESATDALVDEFYVAFNGSFSSFSQIFREVSEAKERIERLRGDMVKGRRLMESRSRDLLTLYLQNIKYKEMIRLLDSIERVKSIPDEVDAAVAGKFFLRAVRLVEEGVRMLMGDDLLGIGALTELRKLLVDKRNFLHELLINELHSHLYLKTPELQKLLGTDETAPSAIATADPVEEAVENPEADSHHYMNVLLEALLVLKKLTPAVRAIIDRLTTELRGIIDDCIRTANETADDKLDPSTALKNSLEMIFERFLRVLKNHTYILSLLREKNERKRLDSTSVEKEVQLYDMKLVWNIIQVQLQMVLQEQLTSSDKADAHGADSSWLMTDTDAARGSKKLFRFARSRAAVQASTSFESPAERKQRITLPGPPPSPHNITAIYKHVVRFNDNALAIFGGDYTENLGGLRLFVDHFIQHEYLTQLQREMRDRVQEAVGDASAFKIVDATISNAPTHDGRVIIPCVLAMASIARQLSEVLLAIPPYVEEVVAIILDSLYRFTTQCELVYDDVLGAHVADDILRAVSNSSAGVSASTDAEIEKALLGRELYRENIVLDINKLALIASLADGLHWLANELTTLFCRGVSQARPPRRHRHQKSMVSTISAISSENTASAWVSEDIAQAVNDLRKLSRHCVTALSIEFRCHAEFYINELKKGMYFSDDVVSEPDSFIMDLNRDLSNAEERLSTLLPQSSIRMIFGALGRMVCRAMLTSARSITQINPNGVAKLCRDLSAVQQNLSNIVQLDDVIFERVRQFFELVTCTDEDIIAHAAANSNGLFTIQDYQWLLQARTSRRKTAEQTLLQIAKALSPSS